MQRYPGDSHLRNFQSVFVPFHTRVNPLTVLPDQHADGSYARSNMVFNSYATPFPQLQNACSSHNAVPVNYNSAGTTYMSPYASSFPGDPNARM